MRLSPEAQKVEDLAVILTGRRSVNGTSDEASFAPFLAEQLGQRSELRALGARTTVYPIPDDMLGRSSVVLHLPGPGTQAVLLTGHFDTVGTSDYGDLEDQAGNPRELMQSWQLKACGDHLRRAKDVASGEFLPGRGLLDMKSGIAAGIAAVERFGADLSRTSHVLIVLTPDEEAQSLGMRDVAQRVLPAILSDHGLTASLAINLDATAEEPGRSAKQIVAYGSIGKLLLAGLFLGKPTHACYPSQGVNAALMAAVVARAFEATDALAEPGVVGAPPAVTLHLREDKPNYDVTTPTSAYGYWNVISFRRTPAEVLDSARLVAERELAAAFPGRTVKVILAEELSSRRPPPPATVTAQDLPSATKKGLADWARASNVEGPTLVLGFASTPYPACNLTDQDARLRRCIGAALDEIRERFTTEIEEREFLPVIADMSFLAPTRPGDLGKVAANTPYWHEALGWDLADEATPSVPCINIGPWGRGYHSPSERVHRRSAFEILPELLLAVLRRVDHSSC
jgi:arginine utilization protein RocB